MYKYLLAVFVLLPLLGIMLMENGGYGPSIGLYGYSNGAAAAYATYAMAMAVTYLFIVNVTISATPEVRSLIYSDTGRFRSYCVLLITIVLGALVVMLFWFGAINVWLGNVGKGEFRASLGEYGAAAYLLTKTFVPALLAYAACLYTTVSRRGLNRVLFWTAAAGAFLMGASWGFKSTAVLMLLPSLLIMYWRITIFRFALISLAVLATVIVFYFVFDIRVADAARVFDLLWTRLTLIQGDVSWAIWNQYVAGVRFPPYAQTLLPVVGDRLFSALSGLDKSDYVVWVYYHYDLMLTYLVGIPLDLIKGGYSITGTPFAESVVALGALGPPVFGVLAGAITGVVYRLLNYSISRGYHARSALLATYFCFYVLSWLSGGAIIQLLHISVIVGIFIAYFAIRLMGRLRLNSPGGRRFVVAVAVDG